jgi:hypothetical protein
LPGGRTGYPTAMRFRLGYATGFATGYYLGAKAGRQRYDQLNRSLHKLRQSEAFETVTERAGTVIDEAVEKAKDLVERKTGGDSVTSVPPTPTPTTADGSSNGTNTIPAAAPLTGQPQVAPPPVEPYSSSK